MILAADLGETTTVLALFDSAEGVGQPLREETFASRDYDAFAAILSSFLEAAQATPTVACFSVPGAVVNHRSHITPLSWVIDADVISESFDIPQVHLINDLHASAIAVPHLPADACFILSPGQSDPTGPISVIMVGTGLGEAFLVWTEQGYQSYPTEGENTSFAPVTHEQLELLDYLEPRFGHVSFERVCSGGGIPNLYDYLRHTGRYEEPDWLVEVLAQSPDPASVIINRALADEARICVATLDLFVRILGGVIGNMALSRVATGGLYLGATFRRASCLVYKSLIFAMRCITRVASVIGWPASRCT